MAVLGLQIACTCEPQLQLRLGLMRHAGCSALALAAEQKLFQEHRLQVEVTLHDDAGTLSKGAYDIVCMNPAELLVHAPDSRIVSIPGVSHGADMILARKDAGADLNILKGARVGLPSASMGGLLLREALRRQSLEAEDFTVLPMRSEELRDGLQKSEIQLVVAPPPLAMDLMNSPDYQVILRSSELPGMLIDAVALRAESLARIPRLKSRLHKVLQDVDGFRAEHPDEVLASGARISRVFAKFLQENYRFLSVAEQQDYLKADGRLVPLIRDLQAVLFSSGELKEQRDPLQFILSSETGR